LMRLSMGCPSVVGSLLCMCFILILILGVVIVLS